MNIKKIALTSMASLAWVSCAHQQKSSKSENKVMEISQISEAKKFDSSAPTFTGDVEVERLFKPREVSKFSGAYVTFSKGARSAWHTHPKGQRLVVTQGSGYVQQWGKEARKIKKGDVIWTPAGVKHWHGAGLKESITHTALQESSNGAAVKWLEKVSDEQYKKAVN